MLAQAFRKTKVFDPLEIIDKPRKVKEPLMFVTVGATLPFDWMINMVAQAKRDGLIPERVLAQVGKGGVRPEGLEEVVETLSFDEMHAMLERANIVVCHGGTGSLITALQHGCCVIVVPRQFELSKHYDDHQSEITAAFRQRGLVQEARGSNERASLLRMSFANAPAKIDQRAALSKDRVSGGLTRRIGRNLPRGVSLPRMTEVAPGAKTPVP
ncbi:glycosyltransferase [Sphingobium sp. CR2-8]|uniref:glycosyltransferase n=1 Tax=Sphingobium sp. CR2-8 TaxID=1306534 RepID=UPI002DB78800|nr:glycosyltransferase [Sphingobium sp. CR2-8]MEC3909836.1 glycosyltransferase [Sphingobium sp. CR2-8]